jgi:hypothetical protein
MPPLPAPGKANRGEINDTGTKKIILKGRKVIGGVAEGEALVTRMPLAGWGNVDAEQGYTV